MSHVQMPMSPAKTQRGDTADSLRPPSTPSRLPSFDGGPPSTPNPTYAAFSPATLSSSSAAKRRSTVLVHQKSPLLLATPPQITRALAYSHPFLLPLNKLAGLLTWTTGDPWESFLLVAAWWAVVLYGSIVVRLAGPIVLVLALIAGMYGRRYSPLSSSGWSDEPANTNRPTRAAKTRGAAAADGSGSSSSNGGGGGGAKADSTGGGGGGGGSAHQRSTSEVTNTRHQKTLDEIVETLKEFTGRCNMLLEPLLELTDFLSTQRTPTSATTRPALTTLFVRILLCTPVWAALTLPPLRIVTARRVVVVVGTVGLTWHARPMRVSRTILWRSAALRRFAALVTGLPFEGPLAPSSSAAAAKQLLAAESSGLSTATTAVGSTSSAAAAASKPAPQESELTKAIRRARGGHDAGVRFTFILYENQRRWVGLGWTTSLFAYERGPWADEHNHAVPPRDQFELPGVNEHGSRMRWRWVEGSRWRVDGVPDDAVRGMAKADGDTEDKWDYDGPGGKMGWVYYDNKVRFPPLPFRRGTKVTAVTTTFSDAFLARCSGKTAAAAKMAGAGGRAGVSGTATRSWSRRIPKRAAPRCPHPRRRQGRARPRRRCQPGRRTPRPRCRPVRTVPPRARAYRASRSTTRRRRTAGRRASGPRRMTRSRCCRPRRARRASACPRCAGGPQTRRRRRRRRRRAPRRCPPRRPRTPAAAPADPGGLVAPPARRTPRRSARSSSWRCRAPARRAGVSATRRAWGWNRTRRQEEQSEKP